MMTYPTGGRRLHHDFLSEAITLAHPPELFPLVKVELAGEDEVVHPVADGVLAHKLLRLLPVDVVAVDDLAQAFSANRFVAADLNRLHWTLYRK